MIHVEPCIGPECRICLQEDCGIRSQAFSQQPSWCRKEVIYPGAAESELDSDPVKNESGRKFTRAGSD